MKRHTRNIVLGLVIGGIAAIVSVTLVGNSSSPDAGDKFSSEPTTQNTPTPGVQQTVSELEAMETVAAVVPHDPSQEGTPVPPSRPEPCGFIVDYDPAQSIEELYKNSFIAVLARVEKRLGAVNGQGGTSSQAEHLSLARVYELSVIEYLKRDGPETIEFVQMEGSFRRSDLSTEVLEDISLFEPQVNCFNPLEIGQEYVMFLRTAWRGENRFTQVSGPHRFAVIDGNAVIDDVLKQVVAENKRFFPESMAEELLTQIRGFK